MSLNAEAGPVWWSVGLARLDGDAEVAWDLEPPPGSGSYAVFIGDHPVDRLVVSFGTDLRSVLTGRRSAPLRSGRSLVDVIKQALAEGVPVRASVAEHGLPPRLRGHLDGEDAAGGDDEPSG